VTLPFEIDFQWISPLVTGFNRLILDDKGLFPAYISSEQKWESEQMNKPVCRSPEWFCRFRRLGAR